MYFPIQSWESACVQAQQHVLFAVTQKGKQQYNIIIIHVHCGKQLFPGLGNIRKRAFISTTFWCTIAILCSARTHTRSPLSPLHMKHARARKTSLRRGGGTHANTRSLCAGVVTSICWPVCTLWVQGVCVPAWNVKLNTSYRHCMIHSLLHAQQLTAKLYC